MMKQEIKKWYKSKTLWINLLLVVGGLCSALVTDLQAGATITAMGVLNIILRLITKSKIE